MDKIALFSDIHGNVQALEAILLDINKEGIKKSYCLGDVLSIGPNSRECMDLLLKNKIPMVLGNHEFSYLFDDYELIATHERDYYYWMAETLTDEIMNQLRKMPFYFDVKIKDYKLYLSHYAYDAKTFEHLAPKNYGEEELLEIFSGIDADYIFVGHEHAGQRLKTSKFEYINMESSGCTQDDITFYYSVYLENERIKIKKKEVKYDRKALIDTMKKIDFPKKEFLKKAFFGID